MKSGHRTLSDLGEFGLIQHLTRSFKSDRTVISVGDDTAVLPYNKSKYQLFTTDILVENVHFAGKTDPVLIGQKALNCNISDIAAMGGLPTVCVISLGVPKTTKVRYLEDIYRGIRRAARRFDVNIVGGDMTTSKELAINVALLGEVSKKNLVTRQKARIGDYIFTTGRHGGSLTSQRHLKFVPRIDQAQYLVRYYKPSAMIDCSDGLSSDLGHIVTQSQVGAIVYADQIPCHKGIPLKRALCDGEDFELIFTLSKSKAEKLINQKHKKFKFYHIGEIVKNGYQIEMDGVIKDLKSTGYNHF